MDERSCLEVAADAIVDTEAADPDRKIPMACARAALDAIHPALAHLTPDDVCAIFDHFARLKVLWPKDVPRHAWEVLSRD